MDCEKIINKYLEGLKEEFKCMRIDNKLRIITPYIYPDNDLIEIFIEDLGDSNLIVTDLGEGFRHLHSQGFDVYASPKRKFLAETIASRVNVEISRGKLLRFAQIEKIHEAIFDVITAIRGIADLIYTSKTYEPGAFVEEVKGFLDEQMIKYESKVKITGESNRIYTVDFEIFNGKNSYLQTLSPKNIQGVKNKVDATVRMWLDFNFGYDKFSLLNDIDFEWKETDITILNRVSKNLFWSEKKNLIMSLKESLP